METDAESQRSVLQNQQDYIQAYLDHPVTREMHMAIAERAEELTEVICTRDVDCIESFFSHWIAIGGLRELRRIKSMAKDSLDEIKEQLNELPKE